MRSFSQSTWRKPQKCMTGVILTSHTQTHPSASPARRALSGAEGDCPDTPLPCAAVLLGLARFHFLLLTKEVLSHPKPGVCPRTGAQGSQAMQRGGGDHAGPGGLCVRQGLYHIVACFCARPTSRCDCHPKQSSHMPAKSILQLQCEKRIAVLPRADPVLSSAW